MNAAYLDQNDLKALEDCLEVARPNDLRRSEDEEPDDDMKTWILANAVAKVMRIMLPKDVDGTLIIRRTHRY